MARYGEYEEVTTGGNDRWPYARWDFSHFAPFYRGLSEYARGVQVHARGAELSGTRTGRRSGPSPEPSPRRAGRGGRGGFVRRHSGTGPTCSPAAPARGPCPFVSNTTVLAKARLAIARSRPWAPREAGAGARRTRRRCRSSWPRRGLSIQAAGATGESARPYTVCGRVLVCAAFLGDGSSRADSDGRETADDVRPGIYR